MMPNTIRRSRLSQALPALATALAAVAAMPTAQAVPGDAPKTEVSKPADADKPTETTSQAGSPADSGTPAPAAKKKRAANPCAGK